LYNFAVSTHLRSLSTSEISPAIQFQVLETDIKNFNILILVIIPITI